MNKNCLWCRKLVNQVEDRTFTRLKQWHNECYKLYAAAGMPDFDAEYPRGVKYAFD